MKFMLAAAVAAGLLLVAAPRDGDRPGQARASAGNPGYRVLVNGLDAGCVLSRNGYESVSFDTACIGAPNLAEAMFWRDDGDGGFALADDAGATIARFAVADGAVWESYEPALPIVSIAPLEQVYSAAAR